MYDRPELQSWHKGRVGLIGDAAHPTSPVRSSSTVAYGRAGQLTHAPHSFQHLGQGANQALEDIYHLIRLLTKYNPAAAAPSTATLESVFTELEQLRIPRTAHLVKMARKMGEIRVVSGLEACQRRNEIVRTMFTPEAAKAMMEEYGKNPFELGKSEI